MLSFFRYCLCLILLTACASGPSKKVNSSSKVEQAAHPKEFSSGEIILATQYLVKIFDRQMPTSACITDTEEASLLLRTINPRMELVQDDIEATLDDEQSLEKIILQCQQDCTCEYIDDLFREHQITLNPKLKSMLSKSKKVKPQTQCLNYIQSTFCESKLFKVLDQEKEEFTYE